MKSTLSRICTIMAVRRISAFPVAQTRRIFQKASLLTCERTPGFPSLTATHKSRQLSDAPSSPTADVQKSQNVDKYESDLIVVLDMDECLIHSEFLHSRNSNLAHQLMSDKDQQVENNDDQVDSFQITLDDGGVVKVNTRPGLHDFLDAVTTKFETHIYTAAMEVYAKPVLDTIDPHGKIQGRWYRDHCRLEARQGIYVKALDSLPIYQKDGAPDLRRVVLVDNNPLSFLANPDNGILVSSFYNDPKDRTLPLVWNLLETLDYHEDIRPILRQQFRLHEVLRYYLSQ